MQELRSMSRPTYVSNPLKIEMSRDSRVYIFPDFLLRDVAGDVSGPDPPEDPEK